MNSSPEYAEYGGPHVMLPLEKGEVEKLLDLVGRDGTCKKLVVRLYLCLMAFTNEHQTLTIDVAKDDILDIHKVFSPSTFGSGGREFRIKLGNAIVEIERIEYLNGGVP